MLARIDDSVVVLVDFQPKFMAPMPDAQTVVARANFLARVAERLTVPILITEQYPDRMGHTDQNLFLNLVRPDDIPIFGKMEFSAYLAPGFADHLASLGRNHVIVAGVETHICVNQTVHHLLESEYDVTLATDAITGRGEDARASALRRMVAAGAVASHTESITYEWMGSAEHAAFRDILSMVKG